MVNSMDVVIVITFLTIIGLGFLGGIRRVMSAIMAIYLGSVFAAAFYGSVSFHARSWMRGMSKATGDLFFFVVLFIVASATMAIVFTQWFGDMRLPRRIEIADNVGGAALGIIVSGLAVTLAAMLVAIMLQAINQTFNGPSTDSVFGWMDHQISKSVLVPVFLRMAPFFVQLISPWFPGGLPPILSGVPTG